MPVYEYWCEDHGVFEAVRPMAEFAAAGQCPDCGGAAPRVMVTAPRRGAADRAQIRARDVNARSADAPRRASDHGPGCGCCKPGRGTLHRPDGSKSFPAHRPWMISH